MMPQEARNEKRQHYSTDLTGQAAPDQTLFHPAAMRSGNSQTVENSQVRVPSLCRSATTNGVDGQRPSELKSPYGSMPAASLYVTHQIAERFSCHENKYKQRSQPPQLMLKKTLSIGRIASPWGWNEHLEGIIHGR